MYLKCFTAAGSYIFPAGLAWSIAAREWAHLLLPFVTLIIAKQQSVNIRIKLFLAGWYTDGKMTKLSEDLKWRGLIKDKTFQDNSWLDTPKKFYLGVDASSDSMTIGNLAVIMLARRLLEAGWEATLLAGGATSLVGDPGGKDEERQVKPKEEILKNTKGVAAQFDKLFAGLPHETVNNIDWLDEVKYLDFLRDIGKYFSMTELMQREFVADRMGEGSSGISYAEFSYSLLQGYDYWWLFKNKGIELQIGASDQWGNILSGVALVRKKEGKEAQAFCMPLVIDSSTGKKFGKSEEGAVWLDPARTTPTQFYQFWVNAADGEVENFLKVYTLLPKEEIEKILNEHQADPSKRIGQTRLAEEVTKIVHGSASDAQTATKYLTNKTSIAEASPKDLDEIKQEIASTKSVQNGSITEALVSSGLASSNSDARRLLASKAVYVNGVSVNRENFEPADFRSGRLILRRGKAYKDSALVELE